MMLTDGQKQMALATICVGVLVVLAFFASYAGQGYSYRPFPGRLTERGPINNPAKDRDKQSTNNDDNAFSVPILHTHDTPTNQAEAEQDAYYQQSRTADQHAVEVGIAAIVVGFLQAVALLITFIVIAFVAIRQLRAYVYPEVKGLKTFNLKGEVTVVMEWKNCGQTPAKSFENHGCVFLALLPLPDKIGFGGAPAEPETGKHSFSTIYPGLVFRSDYEFIDGALEDEVIEAIKSDRLAFYVSGQAYYRDIFGFKRRTEFCQYVEPRDTRVLIDAEQRNLPLDFEVRFVPAHVLNNFT